MTEPQEARALKQLSIRRYFWIVFSILISSAVVFYESLSSYQIITETAEHDIASLVDSTESQISEIYSNTQLRIENTLLKIQSLQEQKKDDIYHLHLLMKDLKREGQYLVTALIDKNGHHITSSEILNPTYSISDRDYFQKLKNEPDLQFVISEPVISKTVGLWQVVLARKITNPKREMIGVIVVTIPISYLDNLLRIAFDKPGSKARLLSASNKVIAQWPEDLNTINIPNDLSEDHYLIKEKKILNGTWVLNFSLSKQVLLDKWENKIILYVFILSFLVVFLFWAKKRLDQLEQQMHAQQMQLLNSAKLSSLGEMAGGIAHEINNPMAIIQLYTELIKNETKQPDTHNIQISKIKNHLGKIENAYKRVDRIIRNMRRISRNTPTEPLVKINIVQLLDNVLDLTQTRLNEKSIHLSYQKPQIPYFVLCQEIPVEQVFINILNNAIDALHQQENPKIEITIENADEKIIVGISNSGPCIPEEIQTKIMEPFFTTKEPGKGTGLGLSLSKKIMQENNGDLVFDHASPQTRFLVQFPQIITEELKLI